MGLKDFMKVVAGIDDDVEITQEEIEERKQLIRNESRAEESRVATPAPAPSTSYSTPISEPLTGFSHKADEGIYATPIAVPAPKTEKHSTMNGSSQFKMIVIEPKKFEECTKLVDSLKARKPIIVNLEKVETELARKMFDFLQGATYALDGSANKVTPNIFIFAPKNVDINAKLNRGDTEAGYPNNNNENNPWRK